MRGSSMLATSTLSDATAWMSAVLPKTSAISRALASILLTSTCTNATDPFFTATIRGVSPRRLHCNAKLEGSMRSTTGLTISATSPVLQGARTSSVASGSSYGPNVAAWSATSLATSRPMELPSALLAARCSMQTRSCRPTSSRAEAGRRGSSASTAAVWLSAASRADFSAWRTTPSTGLCSASCSSQSSMRVLPPRAASARARALALARASALSLSKSCRSCWSTAVSPSKAHAPTAQSTSKPTHSRVAGGTRPAMATSCLHAPTPAAACRAVCPQLSFSSRSMPRASMRVSAAAKSSARSKECSRRLAARRASSALHPSPSMPCSASQSRAGSCRSHAAGRWTLMPRHALASNTRRL
mmetsp:Transcript_15929/g.62247  ORF Transcript_15929/g.62247 Transcript_15929/m.62247 type:complete len:359 (-) Transcript_15929:221-1297(-)